MNENALEALKSLNVEGLVEIIRQQSELQGRQKILEGIISIGQEDMSPVEAQGAVLDFTILATLEYLRDQKNVSEQVDRLKALVPPEFLESLDV